MNSTDDKFMSFVILVGMIGTIFVIPGLIVYGLVYFFDHWPYWPQTLTWGALLLFFYVMVRNLIVAVSNVMAEVRRRRNLRRL